MTDLEIIKQLEKELGITLKKNERRNHNFRSKLIDDTEIHVESSSIDEHARPFAKAAYVNNVKENRRFYFSEWTPKKELVTSLTLKGKRLTEVPPLIFKLENLKYLDLSSNKINFLPELEKPFNIKYFKLKNNNITEIPESFIEYLALGYNDGHLDLSNNKIEQLPISVYNKFDHLVFTEKETENYYLRNDNEEKAIFLMGNKIKYPKLDLLKDKSPEIINTYYNFLEKHLKSPNTNFKNKDKILPIALKNVNIKLHEKIGSIKLNEIPVDTQWIFLTGNNGFGKTSILREIANCLYENDITTEGNLVELKDQNHSHINKVENEFFVPLDKFVAYGAYRTKPHPTADDIPVTDNLFGKSDYILNFESRFKEMWAFPELKAEMSKITEILKKLIPNIADIKVVKDEKKKLTRVVYTEKDQHGELLPEVSFEQLAMGMRNIIGLVTDMIFRLSQTQEIDSQMQGIVIIDEFDNHLHPKWQKELVQKLTEIFPKIQFIVSTHSPIPLLGAPENSIVIKVDRTKQTGITAQKLDIDFTTLTPNSILTSPIFGFENLTSDSKSANKFVETEDYYPTIENNERLKKQFQENFTTEKAKNLMNLLNLD